MGVGVCGFLRVRDILDAFTFVSMCKMHTHTYIYTKIYIKKNAYALKNEGGFAFGGMRSLFGVVYPCHK